MINGNAPLIPEYAINIQSLYVILYSYFLLESFINGKNIKITINLAIFIRKKKQIILNIICKNYSILINLNADYP